jgi:ectoine hydroxylase-related dioxygenase (phytanoyl-CoA dioxygenase family)
LTEWLQKSGIDEMVKQLLSPAAHRIRSLFFDKTPENNWKVPWHQDLTIAVQQRHPLPDFGPWSIKEGIDHVQPPFWVLQRCLTVRIHLDDCPADNGALRVRPGSHLQKGGPLEGHDEVVCPLPEGGVLLMSPLLFHASSKSQIPARRRVIHLEYCDADLPQPLQWWES